MVPRPRARPGLIVINREGRAPADNFREAREMVEFAVRIELKRLAPGRYRARAVATPRNVELRSAPEERSIECASLESAHRAGMRLAESLCRDIAARGNRVVEREGAALADPSPAIH
jgi:hypothetical protein